MMILPNLRSYEKYAAVPPAPDSLPLSNPLLRVAALVDPDLGAALAGECTLLPLDREDWDAALTAFHPNFLLTQPLDPPPDYTLLAQCCRAHGIPTIFWDTTGDARCDAAFLFDVIFAAHAHSLPLYEEVDHGKKAIFLPHGISLRRNGPINTTHFARRDLSPSPAELRCLRHDCTHNTYTARLATMLRLLGCEDALPPRPGVTILTATNKSDSMETVFANYDRQRYTPREMVVLLNDDSMDLDAWRARAAQSEHVTVLRIDERLPLGRCLNEGLANSDAPYVTKFDDDNYYAPEFLTDLMNAFPYVGVEIIGKLSYFCYFEGSGTLALLCPGMENRYVRFVSGSGLVIRRSVFDSVRFGNKPQGSDSVFLRDCVRQGVRMYSADHFNYVYVRRASKARHTFKISDEVLLRSCQFVAQTPDFHALVTV